MEHSTDMVIIGAGLTGLTLACRLRKAGINVIVIEKESRAGGVMHTEHDGIFTWETGPNTGVIGTPELVALFDLLKDKIEVETPRPHSKNRWIWKNDKWNALPSGLSSAVSTPLFSFRDKIRILGEPFRKPGQNPDETVADMVVRRLGRSFLEYAVDPFISGVYAGDPHQIVTRYALPKLYALEHNYGSFIKGTIKKRKEPKSDLQKRTTREVFSVRGGLSHLVDALQTETGTENILLNCSNLSVSPNHDGTFVCAFRDSSSNEIKIHVQKIITTIPGNQLPPVLPFLGTALDEIAELNYAKVVQVVACYKEWKGMELNAFGGLVPSIENRQCLGILFTSSLFENRAPENGAVLSMFIGGVRKPEMIDLSDDKLKQLALNEIRQTLNCDAIPDVLNVYRYQNAIPQYERSSGARLEAIDSIQSGFPGLILAGNIRDGIGMADRVKQAMQLADVLIQESNK